MPSTSKFASRRWNAFALFVLMFIQTGVCKAQDPVAPVAAADTSNVDYLRLGLIGTGGVATIVGAHIYQRDAWWQGPRGAFRFQNDWQYALNIDKIGHGMGGYFEAKLFKSLALWIGLDSRSSTFYGSVFGMMYQLYVELEDGFHQNYGFSPGDALADIIGASIPLAQEAVPGLEHFGIKFSYWPTKQLRDDLKNGKSRTFIDDYAGQVFWINMDPHFFLGEKMNGVVPKWLGVAVGAGVTDLNGSGGGTRRFYFALDYNLSKIETSSAFLRGVFTMLDFLHYPAPGIRLEGKHVSVGLF
jgi:hypothetical protein